MNQSKLVIKTCSRRGARENVRDRIASVSKRILVQNFQIKMSLIFIKINWLGEHIFI